MATSEHKVTTFRARSDLLPFVACLCGWNFKGDDVLAPYHARDLLLDEFSAHVEKKKAEVRRGGPL